METIRELDISRVLRALREASNPSGHSPSKQKNQTPAASQIGELSEQGVRRDGESRPSKSPEKPPRRSVIDDSGPPSGLFPHRGPLPAATRTAKRKTKINTYKKDKRPLTVP